MAKRSLSPSYMTRVGMDLLQRGAPASARVDPRTISARYPAPADRSSRSGQRGLGGAMLGVTITIEERSRPRPRPESSPSQLPGAVAERTASAIDSLTRRKEVPKQPDRPKPMPHIDIYDRIAERGGMLELD